MTFNTSSNSFVIEFGNGAFYASIPLIGALFIERDPNSTSVPFSTEKEGRETLGCWGKVRWVLTPWSIARGARA